MKRCLPMLIALFIGLSVLCAPGAAPLFAGNGPHWGQGRGHDNEDRDDENRGQRKKEEREERHRFSDRDRQFAHEYFEHHRDDREFRDRRWDDDDDGRIAYGYILEPRYRRMCRPVPVVLLRELPPCPRGYRYYMLGTHVIMVDDGYRVQDVIHLEINLPL